MSQQRYSDQDVIHLVIQWDQRYPGALTLDRFCRETGIGGNTIQRRFGGWLQLRTAAGLERRKSHLVNARTHTSDEFVAKLQIAVGHYGQYITQQEFCTWMGVSPGTLATYCGSWRKLRAAVGLPERKLRQRLYSNWDLLAEASRLIRHYGRWPTAEEINRYGRFSYATFAERFGGMRELQREHARYVEACRQELARRRSAREAAKPQASAD